MTQALPKTVTFDEFIAWYPENSSVRYELHNGVIIEMPKSRGKHGNVAGFLIEELVLGIIQIGFRGIWTYAALGGRNFIGNPKQPTIFVCQLVDGEYQMTTFRGSDLIVSPTFPQLNLTAQQIFDAAL